MLLIEDVVDAKSRAPVDELNDLKRLCLEVFAGDTAATALALGREEDQLKDVLSGTEEIDEDLAMKIHGLEQERLGAKD
jgi:hypothetical protein